MAQHTPGPWVVNGAAIEQDQDRDAQVIAHVYDERDGIDEWGSNARLIAAAPELLAALREACSYIYATNPEVPAIHQRACELIARVEGREV